MVNLRFRILIVINFLYFGRIQKHVKKAYTILIALNFVKSLLHFSRFFFYPLKILDFLPSPLKILYLEVDDQPVEYRYSF